MDEAPEPIRNVFIDEQAPPEEKTIAPVGPINEVHMQESTEPIPNAEETEAAVAQDMRVPVGNDAGAPEVTAAEEDVGGWRGGAEDEAGVRREVEVEKEEEVVGKHGVNVVQTEVDLEVEAALKADGGQ